MIIGNKEKTISLPVYTTINALDPSQKYILDKLTQAHTDDLSLIYGPPGTGKSHLIVSLLFELAAANKKVLFVSQNREAIDVVIRKYRDLDKKMHIQDTDLSFLDLCLHLSDPSQRTLKYIRELRTRLYKGFSPTLSTESIDNQVPYAISYTKLNKEDNYNISYDESTEIGIDELLAYDLEFVGDRKNLVKCSLRRINEINARELFTLLKEHKKEAEYFKFFCKPTGALELLAPANDAVVTIGGIQDIVEDIVSSFEKSQTIHKIRCISDNNIENVITYLSAISATASSIDVIQMKKDGIAFREVYSAIRSSRKLKEKLIDTRANLLDLDLPEEALFAGSRYAKLRMFGTAKDLFDFQEELNKLEKVLEIKTTFGDAATVVDIIQASLRGFGVDCVAIADELNFNSFEASDIVQVLKDSSEWMSRGGLYRAFNSSMKPKSIHELEDAMVIRINSVHRDSLETIVELLDNTNCEFKDLVKIQKSGSGSLSSRYKRTQLVEIVNSALKLTSGSLRDILSSNPSISELRQKISDWRTQIQRYEFIRKQSSAISGSSFKADLETINDNIANRNTIREIDNVCLKYKKYFKLGAKNDLLSYLEKIGTLSDKNIGMLDIALACYDFSEVNEFDQRIRPQLDDLSEKVVKAKESKLFSEDFFRIVGGEELLAWNKRIAKLLDYSNRAELDYYVRHKDFVTKLAHILKPANDLYLKNYFAMELDYEDFSQRIAYDVIRGLYDNIPPSECKSISSKKYFDDFKNNLSRLRAKHYKQSLVFMRNRLDDAARRLARPNALATGNSLMDKIRANTGMITDAYPVIMATPAEVSKYISPNKEIFDYVIFDEASQLLPGQAIPSIYRAKKAVIVGDPHQMPPTSNISIGAIGAAGGNIVDLDDSILDLVKSFQIDASYHLKVHYRSKYNVLFEPSRRAIYSQDDIRPIFEAKSIKMPLFVRDGLGVEEEVIYRAIIDRINEYIEQNPKTTLCLLFTQKYNKGMATESGFKHYLEDAGDSVKAISDKYSNEEILISTITNCQGISGDHTILCIPSYTSPRSMFFFRAGAGAYKRLNVSITRQIESLDIIMGDTKEKWINACRQLADDQNSASDVILSAELMLGLLEGAGKQIDEQYLEEKLGPNADCIDSPLTEELYEMLSKDLLNRYGGDVRVWCEVGYKIRTPDQDSRMTNDYNVGYRIDLGVYSRKHKRFILGIEMDGATYHSGFSKEFSDFQRQEILEDKGWHIYRVWSTNWLNDKTGEFESLIRAIDEEYQKPLEIEEVPIEIAPEPIMPQGDTVSSPNTNPETEEEVSDEEGDVNSEKEWILPQDEISKLDYWNKMRDYLKNHLTFGRPIELKYVPNEPTEGEIEKILSFMPYQKLVLKNVASEYIEVRYEDSPVSAYFRVYKKNIVAFRDI